jgi:hypothetical protein
VLIGCRILPNPSPKSTPTFAASGTSGEDLRRLMLRATTSRHALMPRGSSPSRAT